MSFSRLLRKFSHPSLVPPTSTDAGISRPATSDPKSHPQRRQTSEPTYTVPRPWKKKRSSTTGRSSIISQQTSTPPLTPEAEGLTTESRVDEIFPPVPVTPSARLTSAAVVSSPETVLAIDAVPDKLAEAWDAVKDDPGVAKASRELDTVGVCPLPRLFPDAISSWNLDDSAGTVLKDAQPFIPVITATVVTAAQSDVGKAIKHGIDKFSEGMPILMKALDELKAVHPFIGGELIQ
jgi:hypothetical protein